MTSRETVERIAETIYGAMRFDRSPAAPEWVPGGNSDAQVIARQAATNIAAAILHGIAGRAEAVAEVVQSEQTGGHALHFPAGYAETLDSLPIGTKLYTHPPASAPEVTHPDDLAVDLFATAMKAKLAAARAKGRGGWDDKDDLQQHLSNLLREHVEKGDPRDVANFCCFLWNRGESISPKQAGMPDVPDGVQKAIGMLSDMRVRWLDAAEGYGMQGIVYADNLLRDATDEIDGVRAALTAALQEQRHD